MKKSLIIILIVLGLSILTLSAKAEGVASEIVGQMNVGASSAQLGSQASLQMTVIGVINIILSVVGIVFVALLVFGGFKYFNSQGQEEKAKEGMSVITAAIIGLVIILLSYSITSFVEKKTKQAVFSNGQINVRD
jgi:heme/copper-type cytochrome/quinol oxidase subunit 2